MIADDLQSNRIKQIVQLYASHDIGGRSNVLELTPRLKSSDLSLIDSISALLEHPQYRRIIKPKLEELLESVSKQILNN
jgi:hypothetical protein